MGIICKNPVMIRINIRKHEESAVDTAIKRSKRIVLEQKKKANELNMSQLKYNYS